MCSTFPTGVCVEHQARTCTQIAVRSDVLLQVGLDVTISLWTALRISTISLGDNISWPLSGVAVLRLLGAALEYPVRLFHNRMSLPVAVSQLPTDHQVVIVKEVVKETVNWAPFEVNWALFAKNAL